MSPETPGLHRLAAVTTQNTGATKLWAGTFTVDAKAKTGPHHHGDLETVRADQPVVEDGMSRMCRRRCESLRDRRPRVARTR